MSETGKGKEDGIFITFEGGEGVGKSTQIQRLGKNLERLGLSVTVSREPGGTPGAEAIRHVVLDTASAEAFGPEMEALLFAAARLDHVQQIIKPALQRGNIVIVDRFLDSTRVYQGASSELTPSFVRSLERTAIDGAMPDLTIILDMDPEIGLGRANARRAKDTAADRFEREALEAHKARRQSFLNIAKAEPERCKVIDASSDIDTIANAIWQHVAPLLRKRGKLQNKFLRTSAATS